MKMSLLFDQFGTPARKPILTLDGNIGDHHRQYSLVYVYPCNPVWHRSSSHRSGARAQIIVIQDLRLAPRKKRSRRRLLIRSTTHTPDQPVERSQSPHWFVDLTAPALQHSHITDPVFHDLSRAASQHPCTRYISIRPPPLNSPEPSPAALGAS